MRARYPNQLLTAFTEQLFCVYHASQPGEQTSRQIEPDVRGTAVGTDHRE